MNLEEAFDFTNWRTHPTRRNYRVFFFKTQHESTCFEQLLIEQKIWFEKDEEENSLNGRYMFAIKKDDLEKVKRLNNLTIGRYRKPFMANKVFRFTVMLVSLVVVVLALLGFWRSIQ